MTLGLTSRLSDCSPYIALNSNATRNSPRDDTEPQRAPNNYTTRNPTVAHKWIKTITRREVRLEMTQRCGPGPQHDQKQNVCKLPQDGSKMSYGTESKPPRHPKGPQKPIKGNRKGPQKSPKGSQVAARCVQNASGRI